MTTHSDPEALPRLAAAEAIENLAGDRELFAQVAQIFLDDTVVQLATIDAALASGDFATARRTAHSIKGSSGTLGCMRLHHYALAMENACASGNLEDIPGANRSMRAELEASAGELRKLIAGA